MLRPMLRPMPPPTRYVELQVTSNYSFLRGASQVEELFARAALLGMAALALTDGDAYARLCRLPSIDGAHPAQGRIALGYLSRHADS